MPTTISFSVRSLVMTTVTALAVLAAYLVGSTQPGSSSALAADTSAAAVKPTIVMTGSGKVTGVPDQLTFALDVRASAPDVSTALNSASTSTRRIVAALRAQNVAFKDVQTTGLSIEPVLDYSGNGPPVTTGYAATQGLGIRVRDLSKAGAAISAAVHAGGNAVRLHDVKLQIGDQGALLARARAAAFDEARSKAQQYASEAGLQLGDVTSVREVHVRSAPSPGISAAAMAATPAPAVPIRAGRAELGVTVSVAWTFA